MKTSTKIVTIVASAAVLAVLAAGGVQVASALNQLREPVKHSISLAAPTPTITATKAPAFVDPVVAAQAASGLTAAQYQAVTVQIAAVKAPGVPFQSITAKAMHGAVDSAEAEFGKPVAIVDKITCPASDNPGAVSWGVTGAAYASAPSCGTGYQASRETAIAKVADRLNDKGLKAGDYVLVFVDWTN